MSESVIVQYVGFESKARVRMYRFVVREPSLEPREFTLTISNDAFNSHRVRFQDAPDICSLKLHRELAVCANHPPETHFQISETELDDYRYAHSTKAGRSLIAAKAAREF